MDLDKIKQVVDLMKQNNLTEFSYEEHEKFKLCLKHGSQVQTVIAAAPASAAGSSPAQSQAAKANANEKVVESPLVGTFYSSPSPDAPSYVKVGDVVKVGMVICIIEAMKVMNEIHAEINGTVTEVLVANSQPVEYGQPLFKIMVD